MIEENRAIHEKSKGDFCNEKALQLTNKHSPSSASLWEIALTFKESVGRQKRWCHAGSQRIARFLLN